MTNLILIRHGVAEFAGDSGHGADPPLSAVGEQEAAAMASYLAAEPLDAIWSSPMRRAAGTASALAAATSLPVSYDERLAEFDVDEPSYIAPEAGGHTKEEFARIWTLLTAPKFVSRVRAAVDDLVSAHRGETVAAVCHGGVIIQALAHLLASPDLISSLELRSSSICRIRIRRSGGAILQTFNEAPWLREEPQP